MLRDMTSFNPDSSALLEHLAIALPIQRYGLAVDSQDFTLFETVFTAEATLDYTSAGGPSGPREMIGEWLRESRAGMVQWQHHLSPSMIKLEGSTASARTDVYAPCFYSDSGTERTIKAFHTGGRYHDELIKRDERWSAFYRALLERFAAHGACEINLLQDGEKVIGGTLSFIAANTMYIMKIAYDEEYARCSPGNLLHEHLLDRFAEDDRVNCLNLVSGAAWHRHWTPACIPLHHHALFNKTPVGLIAYCTRRLRQKARSIYHQRIKPLLKRKRAKT